MKKRSEGSNTDLQSLIGLGNQSARKTYYAELEAKIVELELEKNRYKGLFDHALHGIFQSDPEGQLLNANHAMASICGFDTPELLAESVTSLAEQLFVSDMDFRRFKKQLLANKQVTNFETLFNKAGEFEHAINVTITAVLKPSPELVIEGFVQDISGQKEAERELLIAATAFDSQEGMMITNQEQVILRVNKAFTRVTGYSATEAIGKTPAMLKSGRHDKAFYQALNASLSEKKYWHGEIWNKRKSGEIYPEYLTITAVESPEGEITNYVAAFTDITRIKESEDNIHRLAYFDTLTGLPNRQALMDNLADVLQRAARTGRMGALLFIDLDNFKNVNDTQGHSIGDQLLIEVAHRLKACIRGSDIAARLGGDEFILVLENIGSNEEEVHQGVSQVLEKVNSEMRKGIMLDTFEYHASCSIGVTPFKGGESPDEVMKRADMAMYQAKWSGKNTSRFYDPDTLIPQFNLAELELDLRNALPKEQLLLYYQPQFDTEKLTGAEVLVRWQHPDKGVISPLEFIPVAEETGLIVPIGWWVLETACQQLKDWSGDIATGDLQLAVNVSARQFSQLNFVEGVKEIIQKTGVNPNRLKLELTESLVVVDIDDTIAKMNELRKLGIRFSLDDFGTGYSSLAHLKKLPLEQLKIDASFVRDIVIDQDDAEIVQTIIAMAYNLGLEVIAEGVETQEQRAFLELSKCRHFQGYLFGRPQPIETFTESYLLP